MGSDTILFVTLSTAFRFDFYKAACTALAGLSILCERRCLELLISCARLHDTKIVCSLRRHIM